MKDRFGEAHEAHAGGAELEGVFDEGIDDVFMLIKVDFVLNFFQGSTAAGEFDHATFLKQDVGVERKHDGAQDEGAFKDALTNNERDETMSGDPILLTDHFPECLLHENYNIN